jgi:cytochrome c553
MNSKIAYIGLGLISVAALTLTACSNMTSRNVADPSLSGRDIAINTCSACHAVTGESISPQFPKLAGQQKEYLAAQIADFKGHARSDSRGTQYMWGFTHLTTKQVDELAEYFSQQPPMRGSVSNPTLLARGETIFRKGIPENSVVPCVACHGQSGEGNGVIPRIAGQHAEYVLEQIKVFQLTEQRPRGAAMKQETHEMGAADAMAVAQYVQSIGAVR